MMPCGKVGVARALGPIEARRDARSRWREGGIARLARCARAAPRRSSMRKRPGRDSAKRGARAVNPRPALSPMLRAMRRGDARLANDLAGRPRKDRHRAAASPLAELQQEVNPWPSARGMGRGVKHPVAGEMVEEPSFPLGPALVLLLVDAGENRARGLSRREREPIIRVDRSRGRPARRPPRRAQMSVRRRQPCSRVELGIGAMGRIWGEEGPFPTLRREPSHTLHRTGERNLD